VYTYNMGESGYSSMPSKYGGSKELPGYLYSGSNMSTSAMIKVHMKTMMEYLRKKFAEYGEPYRVGKYKDFKMYYDSGDPSMFWLHADTKSLHSLQRLIQKSVRKKTVGDGGGVGVQVGSLVLARYKVDKLVYRAKVEKITEDVYCVRYIDYGNMGENLPRSDIYSWYTLLDMIPPQAVSCTLQTLNRASAVAYTEEQVNEFSTCMKAHSPMQMTVHQRLTSLDMNTTNIGPDIIVSLLSEDGENIVSKLSHLPGFKDVFSHDAQIGLGGESNFAADLPEIHNLTVSNVNKLDIIDPFRVPPPLHLDGEALAQVYQHEPTSPLHSEITRKAVEKVHWWLNRTEDAVEPTFDDDKFKKEGKIDLKFTEPELVENTIIRVNMLSEAGKKLHEDDSVVTAGSSPVTSRPKPAKHCRPVSVFPSVDVGSVEAPASTLPMQEVELDANGEFEFMVSAINSPEGFKRGPGEGGARNVHDDEG